MFGKRADPPAPPPLPRLPLFVTVVFSFRFPASDKNKKQKRKKKKEKEEKTVDICSHTFCFRPPESTPNEVTFEGREKIKGKGENGHAGGTGSQKEALYANLLNLCVSESATLVSF